MRWLLDILGRSLLKYNNTDVKVFFNNNNKNNNRKIQVVVVHTIFLVVFVVSINVNKTTLWPEGA